MDQTEILDSVYKIIDEIKKSDEFILLLSLKKEINETLSDILTRFNTLKEKYNEALKYSVYHPDLESIQKELSKCKEELYSYDIVKKYIKLEREIQKKLDEISNKLKSNISNKYELTKIIGV